MEVTLEQLCTAIECWNKHNNGGSFSADVQDILAGMSLFAHNNWTMIDSGPLAGCRYWDTEHGCSITKTFQ